MNSDATPKQNAPDPYVPLVDATREDFPVDVLIVGGGPAGLACAYHLRKLVQRHDESNEEKLGDTMVVLIDKAAAIGDHSISGAVMDPKAIAELVPDYEERGCPIEKQVERDRLLFLSRRRSFGIPFSPPTLKNHGFPIISLNKFSKWLGGMCEAEGVNVFPGFPGRHLLLEGDDRVAGVITGDKGIDKSGEKKSNFEPGLNLRAKVTVFAEGVRGSLTKELTGRMNLAAGKNPQIYATGVKEVWEVPEGRTDLGQVLHTMGWPLRSKEFGGGFIYTMDKNLLSVGFVVGIDYRYPWFDAHEKFSRWKEHPVVASFLQGGQMLHYGAKAIPEGGYYSLLKNHGNGFLIIGDAGGYLNTPRLKGIHLAIKSGMLAAETIYRALVENDFSESRLSLFQNLIDRSWVRDELFRARNFRQGFRWGLIPGLLHSGLQFLSGGRLPPGRAGTTPDHAHLRKLSEIPLPEGGMPAPKQPYDGAINFDKLTDVYHSGTIHEENQPSHLVITRPDLCNTRCSEEFGNPCQYFCPANVYEMEENEATGARELRVNFTNCVHCKTCDIMDPYQVITWVTPEGGGGPVYTNL